MTAQRIWQYLRAEVELLRPWPIQFVVENVLAQQALLGLDLTSQAIGYRW
jgi:hypothetical protein